jgi:tripartite-type tricarboxylate transporter receptor subunit TctC
MLIYINNKETLMTDFIRSLVLCLSVICTISSWRVHANDFPNKPIKIIVPFAPGGSNDVVMRLLAPSLSEELGQSVIVENRPGGGATIGMDIVAKSKPDGYTLGVANTSFGANPFVISKMPFDTQKDLSPVCLVGKVPLVVIVNPQFPVRSIKELIEYAKKNPEVINYGSAGNASAPHLAGALFEYSTGTKLTHIPYKSGGEATAAILGNITQLQFAAVPSAIQQIRSNRLIPLAVTTLDRDESLPEVPTVDQSGVKDFDMSDWIGIVVPAGTPDIVIKRLNEAFVKALTKPENRASLTKAGARPIGSSPEELKNLINKELNTWQKVVKAANIKVN